MGATPGRFESCRWHMKPGTRLRHFKGSTYVVDVVATCALTGRPVIVYTSQADGLTWVRPLEEFDERIVRDGYDGPRFVVIE